MGSVIAVSSGKGGVGKSSFCCLAGTALSEMGKKVVIIELDFGLRCLDIMLGLEDRVIYDLGDVLSNSCEIGQAVVKSEHYDLSYIAAGLDYSKTPDPGAMSLLCSRLSKIYDFVILDFPAGIEAAVKIAPLISDVIIVISTPDPVCVRDGNMFFNAISKFASGLRGTKKCEIRMIINRFNRSFKKTGIANLDSVIDDVGVQLLGVIPESEAIVLANANGDRLGRKYLSYRVYKAIAGRLCGEYIPLLIK